MALSWVWSVRTVRVGGAALVMALEDEGYVVQAAHDGAEAIDCLRQGQFDVVLLDLMMANVSGWKFLELYRQSPGPLTPVIVLSALQRDKLSLDLFWVKEDSLEDSSTLADPDAIAAEIIEDLRAALDQFEAIGAELAAPY